MALENAMKFLQKVQDDQSLQDRLAGMTPEERREVAREMGLDYTEEELTKALQTIEISEEEMEQAFGGYEMAGRKKWRNKKICPESPDQAHHWVLQGHKELPYSFLFWDFSFGFDVYVCTNCGQTKDVRT